MSPRPNSLFFQRLFPGPAPHTDAANVLCSPCPPGALPSHAAKGTAPFRPELSEAVGRRPTQSVRRSARAGDQVSCGVESSSQHREPCFSAPASKQDAVEGSGTIVWKEA